MDLPVLDAESKKSEFLNLPTEIHFAIINQLFCPGRPSLKLTSRYFFELVPSPTHADLLAAEDPVYDGEDPDTIKFLACRDCLRLRPSYNFADRMRKGRFGGRRSHAFKRFCIHCFLNPKPGKTRHAKGMYVEIMGDGFVLCRECMEFKAVPSDQGDKRRCGECVEKERVLQRSVAHLASERCESAEPGNGAHDIPMKRSWILGINLAMMKILRRKRGG